MADPEVTPALPPAPVAPPKLPPLPTTEGDLRSIHADIKEIKDALTLLCGKVIEGEKVLADAKPLIDQVKAKLFDAKTGKLKFWPF